MKHKNSFRDLGELMKKRISTNQIRVGMFVQKLECKWTDHPFLMNKFKIKSETEITKIRKAGIKFLEIDTQKGLDVQRPSLPSDVLKDVSFSEEIEKAKKITQIAREKVTGLFEDVKLGQQIQVGSLNEVADHMTNSVFRNPNALLCLGQIRSKDDYLFEHSVNLGVLISIFAKHKGFTSDVLNELVLGALLHDIGKIKVKDEILNKPGRLTTAEFEHMKLHVAYTKELLDQTDGIPKAAIQIAEQHHEKIDGSGYMKGLRGDEISLFGRMAGIVDVYDALTATRCYKTGLPPSRVLQMMTEWGENHLDQGLLREFIRCLGVFPVGSMVELTDGHLALVIESTSFPLRPVVRMVMHKDSRKVLQAKDLSLADSDLRIVDFVNPLDFGIQISNFL